jgi:hypothetical protein
VDAVAVEPVKRQRAPPIAITEPTALAHRDAIAGFLEVERVSPIRRDGHIRELASLDELITGRAYALSQRN